MTDFKTNVQNITSDTKIIGLSIFAVLSFYAPVLITTAIILFSVFSGALIKGIFYLFWIFVVTAIRMGVILLQRGKNYKEVELPQECNTGAFLPYTTPTYSTFILCFTLFYFLTPMILVSKDSMNAINYGVVLFFISYIVLDLLMKKTMYCIPGVFSIQVFSDLIGGIGLGAIISSLIYGSNIKGNLFINEIITNKEVCSQPSKQQFRCAVYKNGELVGSSVK